MGTIPKSPEKNSTIWNQFQSEKTKNTTLWEQFQNGHNFFPHYGNNSKMKKKYHTMGTIPKWLQKNTTLWEQFQNGYKKIPHYGNNSKMKKTPQYGNNSKMKKKYHNMETIPKRKTKNTTLWKQFQNWIVSS